VHRAHPANRSHHLNRTPHNRFVVDDDISVRESLELLIRSEGWQPETFESAQEFLHTTSARSKLPRARRFSSGP